MIKTSEEAKSVIKSLNMNCHDIVFFKETDDMYVFDIVKEDLPDSFTDNVIRMGVYKLDGSLERDTQIISLSVLNEKDLESVFEYFM